MHLRSLFLLGTLPFFLSPSKGQAPPCPTMNVGPLDIWTFTGDAEYAIQVIAPNRKMVVSGFQLKSGFITTQIPNVTLTTGLYLAGGGGLPNSTPARTGTMKVYRAEAWYSTHFAPILLAPGQRFFIAFRAPKGFGFSIRFPAAKSGVYVPWYLRKAGMGWSGGLTKFRCTYKLFCDGKANLFGSTCAPENFYAQGSLFLGGHIGLNLSRYYTKKTKMLFMGLSRKKWLALNLSLPWPLPYPYKQGCMLNVSPDFLIYCGTNPYGHVLRIPVILELIGIRLYFQWFIFRSPYVSTQGAEVLIGG